MYINKISNNEIDKLISELYYRAILVGLDPSACSVASEHLEVISPGIRH